MTEPTPPQSPSPPPPFDPLMFPSRHRPFLQFLLDHNPCLLLSTVCMLLGCYLINSAINITAGPDQAEDVIKLLSLLGVINLYEACIIPLGLILIRRSRGIARDGLWLILFETLFLVNATFLNVDPSVIGWSLNLLLYLLALVKVGLVLRGLRVRLSLRTFGFLALQLALIYGLPVFFGLVNVDGVVSPRIMYTLWWIVGLLPLAYDLLARWDGDRNTRDLGLVQQVIRRVYLIIPWILLVVHLRFSHWAHHCDFQLAYAAPVFIGLAAATLRLRPTSFLPQSNLQAVRIFLPLIALFISLKADPSMSFTIPGFEHDFPPILITSIFTMIHYACFISLGTGLQSLAAITLAAVGDFFHSRIIEALRWLYLNLEFLIPTSVTQWGFFTIIVAFLLLIAGAAISLRRPLPPLEPPDS